MTLVFSHPAYWCVFAEMPMVWRTKLSKAIDHVRLLFIFRPSLPMLLCPLLALPLIPRPVSARLVESNASTTNTTLTLPSGSPNRTLDAGNLGSAIGGASAAAMAVIMIALAFAMLRRSRRQNCLCHSEELGEIVPSLPYQKRNVNAGTASVDTFEFDVPAPALLRTTSHKTNIVPVMRERHIGEPPIYSLSTIPTGPPIAATHSLSQTQ